MSPLWGLTMGLNELSWDEAFEHIFEISWDDAMPILAQCQNIEGNGVSRLTRATQENRTPDLLFTRELLYRLS